MCTANPRVFLTSEFGIISLTKVLPKPSRILFGREAEKGKIRTIPRTVQAVRYRTKIHHNFGKIMVTYTLHTVHRFLFLIFPARGPLSLICMFISSSQEGASNDIERTLFETCTSRLQTWNQPRKRKLDSQSVYEIDFSKKIYRREERNNAKPLNDPRRPSERNNDPKNVNRELLDKIKRVKPNCGFFCLLSDEKLDQNKNDIISPIKEHPVSLTDIFDRAKIIKRNLVGSDQERQNIALATKAQSNCQAWFEHRRVRITASQSKRALIKPSTSPTKAMKEILHYNNQYQRNKMKQGLKDEKKIILEYENKLDCKVSETGFVISQSHPFFGASPDGEVDGGLVEMKRIFTDGLSLKEAVCKRRICRDTCHGLVINRNHKFYYQVQQLMLCTKSSWTDLVLSDTVNLIILHVRKDKKFLSDIVPKLEKFYDNHISLELAYPRVYYVLTRLSKLIN